MALRCCGRARATALLARVSTMHAATSQMRRRITYVNNGGMCVSLSCTQRGAASALRRAMRIGIFCVSTPWYYSKRQPQQQPRSRSRLHAKPPGGVAQQRAHVHKEPGGRTFAEPCNDVVARAGSAGPAGGRGGRPRTAFLRRKALPEAAPARRGAPCARSATILPGTSRGCGRRNARAARGSCTRSARRKPKPAAGGLLCVGTVRARSPSGD